jgi:hypothetical protein
MSIADGLGACMLGCAGSCGRASKDIIQSVGYLDLDRVF